MNGPSLPAPPPPSLQATVLAGLERLIWAPAPGVADADRVEAVQLLGQFHDPAAGAALGRVLRQALSRLGPGSPARWLRDTALDTLLRAPAQQGPATDRILAGYYSFWAHLRQGRLERNVIYDDIPLLLHFGRGRLVLRSYVLPLVSLLLGLVVLAEVLTWLGGLRAADRAGASLQSPGVLLGGLVLFAALGLGLFNLHQVALVWLVARARGRPVLPGGAGLPGKAGVAGVLALAALGLALYASGEALYLVTHLRAEAPPVPVSLLLLPLLVVPCYMLAHDLETGAAGGTGGGPRWGFAALAVILRWACGLLYIAFVLVAFAWSAIPRLLAPGPSTDLAVALGMLPFVAWLVLAPVPVLLILAGVARLRAGGPGRPAADP